ncbi:DUF3488 and transglutaminase-like domain-containing protein [Blastopirellula sp. JC732]|uniref:DUF3488 and transglutaminase-like domain-containing protein n=1 Tax=Blastopirellula sediminis TaxID=2894196 RepID=A0A9X1SF46_9BACT|nr:DUF3488 and transglutaminase-like domain-containing protein [Blastopirellula sediminis]MCC9609325.1 DUF3488 and transglutaminase-like domain-containing protein [Blastopirellula sediminis]MCC9627898.1 DUF3488 and transglutaminase-like domain-containing protein [Blastopirellula sediminis]
MKVERLLQISVAVLAALGAMLLGGGETDDAALPIAAVAAAFISVYVTDIQRWFSLNRNLANIAALLAVAFSISDFWPGNSTEKLQAIAKLLIYLQIVLLFQRKSTRVYWHLCVLSLLQVVVAAALNLNVSFGFMLVAYMFAALTTLSLFFIYRETVRVDPVLKAEHDAIDNRPVFALFGGRDELIDVSAANTEAVVLESRLPKNLATVFSSWQMFVQVCKLGFVTLIATVVVFYAFPRPHRDQWGGGLAGGLRETGFKDQISFDRMGRIMQSDEMVMRVGFRSPVTDMPKESSLEPYFRGTVLNRYQIQTSSWITTYSPDDEGATELPTPPPGVEMVRQRVVLNPRTRLVQTAHGHLLFSVYPAYRDRLTSPEIIDDRLAGFLSYATPDALGAKPSQYNVLIPWRPAELENRLLAVESRGKDKDNLDWRTVDYLSSLKKVEVFAFGQLQQTTREAIADSKIDPNNDFEVAQTLERFFTDDGGFNYTLEIDPRVRDPNLDPLEDFVVNHRSGHCEYFAGAMALMLRYQQIPSRIVVGYKGGEYNSVGGYYAVKQMHAHAWVEAYIKHEDLPEAVRDSYPTGAWLRLDPTPSGETQAVYEEKEGFLSKTLDWFDYLELMWRDYVVEMNSERQENAIYKPFTDRIWRPLGGWFNYEEWRQWVKDHAASIGIDIEGEWFSWYMSLLTIFCTIAGFAIYQGGRWLFRRYGLPLWRWVRRQLHFNRHGVTFYLQLERRLAKCGMRRNPGQTPYEFVDSLRERLTPVAMDAIAPIVEAYYRVRFGGVVLSEDALAGIDERMLILQGELDQLNRAPRF